MWRYCQGITQLWQIFIPPYKEGLQPSNLDGRYNSRKGFYQALSRSTCDVITEGLREFALYLYLCLLRRHSHQIWAPYKTLVMDSIKHSPTLLEVSSLGDDCILTNLWISSYSDAAFVKYKYTCKRWIHRAISHNVQY